MKIFRKQDGGIIQIIDKEKMEEWPIELPLIFVEYIRNNKLATYGEAKVKKEVEKYLSEITKDVAIPRFIGVLEGENTDEIIVVLTRIEELSKKNLEMVRPIKEYLDKLLKNKNKDINKIAGNIEKSFAAAERKKELAKKRKIMQQKESQFLSGKISPEDYAKARKDYLTLKG